MIRFCLLRLSRTIHKSHRNCHSKWNQQIRIGNLEVNVQKPARPYLVPAGFHVSNYNTTTVSHLKWLLQKDLLKQDVFLIGAPGFLRSGLIMQYLELCKREYEYLSITRDTTEADIKQRREIRNGTAFYTDLCAVRAALNGRILIVDGVEKAERNVLPILNSLLENREMQLDDGRFLIAAHKYDALVQELGEKMVKEKKLERVSENFFVIALGLPVPPFRGHPIDPPLRSRFQCRHIHAYSFGELLEKCKAVAPSVNSDRISNLVSFAVVLNSPEAKQLSLPYFPVDNLERLVELWNELPYRSGKEIFEMGYPFRTLLKPTQLKSLDELSKKFDLDDAIQPRVVKLESIQSHSISVRCDGDVRTVKFQKDDDVLPNSNFKKYISTMEHDRLIAEMAVSLAYGDFCLLGPKGSGKTTVIEELARRMKYSVSTMMMYQDMNSRELLQERRMLPNGDTIWEDSVLVDCAKAGRLCILDGIERMHWSALELLSPLIHHRQIDLFDGSRLLGSSRFQQICESTGLSKAELEKKGIYEIHPSFRIVAIGDWKNENKWLNEQLLSLFTFHTMEYLSRSSQCHVISSLVPDADHSKVDKIVDFVEALRQSHDEALQNVAQSLSLRRLIYIMQRLTFHKDDNLGLFLRQAALSRFLPLIVQSSFDKVVNDAQIDSFNKSISSVKEEKQASSFQLFSNGSQEIDRTMVPDVLFYDNEQHLTIMKDMARDMELGAHILLIGNQGVGKNKITDRLLQLQNRPRQYLQLHRDTTVQSLTVHSTVVDGRLMLEDSALVKAAKNGNVLVIDEADKAPLHVVAALKSLLDIGVIRLADGRTIQPFESNDTRSIFLHPSFRVIMLANRPGFPFLGNDLFSILGDLFAVHIVDNPSRDSELVMLKKYAPDVDVAVLDQLCSAFGQLRLLSDEGILQYPYSTRELVNVARHLQKYPTDGITVALKNVFDFDRHSADTMQTVSKILRNNGIPFDIENPFEKIFLATSFKIESFEKIGTWGIVSKQFPRELNIKRYQLNVLHSSDAFVEKRTLSAMHMRSNFFSEQDRYFQLPIEEENLSSCIANYNSLIAVMTVNPPFLNLIDPKFANQFTEIDLSSYFPSIYSTFRPQFKISFLTENLLHIHEELTNTLLQVNLNENQIKVLSMEEPSIFPVFDKLTGMRVKRKGDLWRQCSDSSFFFQIDGSNFKSLDLKNFKISHGVLPEDFKFQNCFASSPTEFIISTNKGFKLLRCAEDGKYLLHDISYQGQFPTSLLALKMVEQPESCVNIFSSTSHLAVIAKGFPGQKESGDIFVSKRSSDKFITAEPRNSSKLWSTHANNHSCILENGIIINALPLWQTPIKAADSDMADILCKVSGFLEIIDPFNETVRYVPVPHASHHNYYQDWSALIAPSGFTISPYQNNSVLTVDTGGGVRVWDVIENRILSSLSSWKKMFADESESLRLELTKTDSDLSKLDEPKIGKFDMSNAPHVGGGTWAGGTGGYNTAGLGGVGGPFRLDAGHDVHQVAQEVKDAVPEHIRKKAREIAKAEYQKRLNAINMSAHDADAYDKLHEKIGKHFRVLRTVIDSLEAKECERKWSRHQVIGDLDDAKLVEGLTGERTIYRRRIDKEPDPGEPLKKPKRMRFCFDVSGSMYRFNGYDRRLERSLESALLVMEALDKKQTQVKYDLIGHSGEDDEIVFVNAERPPENEKERMNVLKRMLAHSQFCMSGDSTLQSMELSARHISNEDADERFLIVVSDANFDRYGIRPNEIVRSMETSENVNTFLILIGSLGSQAQRWQNTLPPGRTFMCTDTSQIPQIMQNIFSSALLR